MKRPGSVAHTLRFGYLQQVVSLGAVFGFNLFVPAVTGLEDFGRFTTAHGLLMLVTGLIGGGLDLVLTRDIRGADGAICTALFWRSLAMRLGACTLVLVLALSPWSPLHDVPARSGIGLGTLLACALAVCTSSHCIAVVIGAMATRHAALLSMLHALPYFALPLLLWQWHARSPASLMQGVLGSYVFIVLAEIWVLRRLAWRATLLTPSLLAAARSALQASPNSLFESVRTWGSVLLASYWLTPSDLGVARTAFSIAAAMVSLTPVPMQAMVSLGRQLEHAYQGSGRLADLLRHVSVLAALGAALAVLAYGMLMPASAADSFSACAAGALLLTACGPITRLALALNTATADGRNNRRVLACALLVLPASAGASMLLGPAGLLAGAALASVPVAGAMPAALRHRIASVGATGFVAAAALATACAAAWKPPLWQLAGLMIALLLGYLVWQRADLVALAGRRDRA